MTTARTDSITVPARDAVGIGSDGGFGVLTRRDINALKRACRSMEANEQDFREDQERTYGDFAPSLRHRRNSERREKQWATLRAKLSSPNNALDRSAPNESS